MLAGLLAGFADEIATDEGMNIMTSRVRVIRAICAQSMRCTGGGLYDSTWG